METYIAEVIEPQNEKSNLIQALIEGLRSERESDLVTVRNESLEHSQKEENKKN